MADIKKLSDEELMGMVQPAPRQQRFEQQLTQFQAKAPTPIPISQRIRQATPAIGQFVGGAAGFGLGGMVGHPYLGSAIGGTAGRLMGELETLTEEKQRENPKLITIATAMGPATRYTALYGMLTPEQKIGFGKIALQTGAIEATLAPLGFGLTKLTRGIGRGILKGLLTPRIAERGIEHGWRNILRPEFFKGRLPKAIAIRTNSFFDKLTKVTGKRIDKLINTTYKNTTANISNIKKEIRLLLPPSGKVEDLLELTAPKAQAKLLNTITDKIFKVRGNTTKLSTLWELRKEIDEAIYRRSWTPDAKRYLMGVRRALNNPIKGAGDDIGEAFGRYSFVKNAEDELGKKFKGIVAPGGEIYSQRLESFTSTLLSSKKDETIRMLVDLDSLLSVEDQLIEELLNYAAAESMQQEVMGMGIFQRMMVGMLGGRQTLAKTGRLIQSATVQGTKKGIGRAIPTLISQGLSPDIPKIIEQEF